MWALNNESNDITDFVAVAILELLLKDGYINKELFEKAKKKHIASLILGGIHNEKNSILCKSIY